MKQAPNHNSTASSRIPIGGGMATPLSSKQSLNNYSNTSNAYHGQAEASQLRRNSSAAALDEAFVIGSFMNETLPLRTNLGTADLSPLTMGQLAGASRTLHAQAQHRAVRHEARARRSRELVQLFDSHSYTDDWHVPASAMPPSQARAPASGRTSPPMPALAPTTQSPTVMLQAQSQAHVQAQAQPHIRVRVDCDIATRARMRYYNRLALGNTATAASKLEAQAQALAHARSSGSPVAGLFSSPEADTAESLPVLERSDSGFTSNSSGASRVSSGTSGSASASASVTASDDDEDDGESKPKTSPRTALSRSLGLSQGLKQLHLQQVMGRSSPIAIPGKKQSLLQPREYGSTPDFEPEPKMLTGRGRSPRAKKLKARTKAQAQAVPLRPKVRFAVTASTSGAGRSFSSDCDEEEEDDSDADADAEDDERDNEDDDEDGVSAGQGAGMGGLSRKPSLSDLAFGFTLPSSVPAMPAPVRALNLAGVDSGLLPPSPPLVAPLKTWSQMPVGFDAYAQGYGGSTAALPVNPEPDSDDDFFL